MGLARTSTFLRRRKDVDGRLSPVMTKWVNAKGCWYYPAAFGAGDLLIAPIIGMKNTPTSRREWILPSASFV